MRFVWDPIKDVINRRKHEVAFEEAIGIFNGWTTERVDARFEYNEIRIQAYGVVNRVVYVVVYTDRCDDERRIISARKATPHERRYFWREYASTGAD